MKHKIARIKMLLDKAARENEREKIDVILQVLEYEGEVGVKRVDKGRAVEESPEDDTLPYPYVPTISLSELVKGLCDSSQRPGEDKFSAQIATKH